MDRYLTLAHLTKRLTDQPPLRPVPSREQVVWSAQRVILINYPDFVRRVKYPRFKYLL